MTRRLLSALVAALAATAAPPGATAQGIESAVLRCSTLSSSTATDRCVEAAVAAQAVLGQTGLLAGFGSEVAGASSTLGRRLGNTPRVSGSLRFGGLQGRVPDIVARGNGPAPEASYFVPALHTGVAVGLFDGFRLLPTLGGFLSVDVVGQTSIVFFPVGQGFSGSAATLSAGLRIGILRESFSNPGISLSVARRSSAALRLGDAASGDPAAIEVDPAVTSLRLVIGKDLLAMGFLAGAGWDDYSGRATLRLSEGGMSVGEVEANIGADRLLFFGGASLTLLILQLSAEVGWGQGFSPVPGYLGAPFDPSTGSIFGSLAARLTI